MRMLGRVTVGLWLWALAFSLLYALHGIGCAGGWHGWPLPGGSAFRWTMVVTWVCFALGGVVVLRWAARLPKGLERRLATVSALVGLAGTIITGSPVIFTSACV
ncbi:hypothetical protein [Sphingobium sp. MK2]|uniref:hypothetical protein n=1 Tax=Sphingobium sp. MK2 TaxID=3116540 RepID=UPI0032E35A33